MIKSFKHKGLKRFHERGDRSGLDPALCETINNILDLLHVAASEQDLALPRYRLHPLKGARQGCWAVTVRANWRIVFRFHDGDAYDVELLDYH